MIRIKEYSYATITIIGLAGGVFFIYNTVSETILGLVRGDDYIFYDSKQIPLLLLLPLMLFFDIMAVCLFLPFRKKISAIIQKLMIPVTAYSFFALITGFILSMIISIYPLSTEYYQCKPTSIVSSGSYYAKRKEICKQNAYQPSTDETQSIILPDRNEPEPSK